MNFYDKNKMSGNKPFSQTIMNRSNNIHIPSPLNLSSTSNDFLDDDLPIDFKDFKDSKELPPLPTISSLSHDTTFHSTFNRNRSIVSEDSSLPIPPSPLYANSIGLLFLAQLSPKSAPPICTICNFLIDEDLLELSCKHVCHRDCFINNILTCKKCTEYSVSQEVFELHNDSNRMEFTTPNLAPTDIPMTPSDQMIPDPLRNSPLTGSKSHALQPPPNAIPNHRMKPLPPNNHLQQAHLQQQQQQLLSPRSSFNKNLNRDLFDSLMKPKVKFLNEFDDSKILVSQNCEDEDYKVNYLINVKPPKFFNSINDDKHLMIKHQIFEEIKFNILNNVISTNDESIIDFNNLGNLIIFEIIDISTNGNNWDQVRLLLFESSLILIDIKGSTLIGQISITKDILDMTRFVSGIRLNLNNQAIPELQICSDIPLIISRLEYYFKKLLNHQFVLETSLFQLTTNGWNLIKDNYSNLPIDILRFQNCIENNLEIPEPILIKTMPSPEILPLNLIISITLLNNSSLTNAEYRTQIIQFLDNVRKSLRSFDRLSLIFVGIDGAGFPCKKGSFIGSVEPNWSGWDSIYNEVKIQSNLTNKYQPILHTGYDELEITLDKCKSLLPFINSSVNSINKLVVINSNDYEPTLINNTKLSSLEAKFKDVLNNGEKNLSIDFFRVGEHYSPELEFGQKVCLQPSLVNNDILKIPYGSQLLRYDTFGEFSINFLNMIHNTYHQICLPNISLDILKIIGSRDIVDFYKIEVNGKLIEVENFSNLKICLNNITVNCENNIMLSLNLKLSKLNFDNLNYNNDKLIDIPLFSYMSSWLSESDDYKVLNANIYQDRQLNNFRSFLDGSLTPPMNDENEDYYQPAVKKVNKRFVKKQIDLEVIKALRLMNNEQTNRSHIVLQNLIGMIIDSKASFQDDSIDFDFNSKSGDISFHHNNISVKNQKVDLTNYVDSLLNELSSLSASVDSNEVTALVSCKDLTNWLV